MHVTLPIPKPRRAGILVTAGIHLLAGWALWTMALSPQAPPLVKPLWVALLPAEMPRSEQEALKPGSQAMPAPPRPMPQLTPPPLPDIVPIATPAPATAAPTSAPLLPAAQPVAEPAAPVAAPALPRPAPPPQAPRLLRADQVRYLVLPPAEVPLLSRRAGEYGVVWLRVRIDTLGRPSRIGLHRSSGFKRLDEQAMAAMSQARFAPQFEDGVPIEAEVIAPIEYPAD